MPHDDNTPTTNTDDTLALLCDCLEDALNTALCGEDALQRQAHILDQVFHTLLHDTLAGARAGHPLSAREETLNLALRIQKQCVETHRTARAMDYMSAITPVPLRSPVKILQKQRANGPASPKPDKAQGAPTPPMKGEQTE